MKLLILRHAQSANNKAFLDGTARVEDPELTELGLRQARLLGDMLASGGSSEGWRPEILYSSLMLRAMHTASIVAERALTRVAGREDIHEVRGIYLDDPASGEPRGLSGAARETFRRRFPAIELPPAAGAEGWWNRPPETDAEAERRADGVSRWLLLMCEEAGAESRCVGLLTHGGFYSLLVPRVLGVAPAHPLHLDMANAACSLLVLGKDERRLVFHNRFCHLPPELVS